MQNRFVNLLIAVVAFTIGLVLAFNYPADKTISMTVFFLCAVFSFYRPTYSLLMIPALLPVIGFAPWTGWMSFEELDLLVLASASGGYAKSAIAGKTGTERRTPRLLLVLAGLMSISLLISMYRGFVDAGGFVFGWFQGYDGPMNSLRIGKSFFLALLMIPLMEKQDESENNSIRNLGWGIAIGLGAASLASLWERLAFTDLLNFSSDYRSTALFWEMHVGGAALDGWLMLTFPFVIWALRNSRNALQYASSLLLVLLAAYASLTTFSRGVYLALIIALPLLGWLVRKRMQRHESEKEIQRWGISRWLIAITLIGVMAALVFPGGGYRGLVALLGIIAASLSMHSVLREISFHRFLSGTALGLLVGMLALLFANLWSKGPYILYAFLFAMTCASLYWVKLGKAGSRATICLAAFVGLMTSAVNVADYWGGSDALWGICGSVLLLCTILLYGAFAKQPLWPSDLRSQGSVMMAAIAGSAVIVIFAGGAYMSERFSTASQDFNGRIEHWRHTIAMLQSPWDISFGKGLGRFPANYYFAIPNGEFPGTYRLSHDDGNTWLSLVGARHPLSFGDILRISQRLSLNSHGPFEVDLKIRAKADVQVHVEVCEKHLLYAGACAIGKANIKTTNGNWQPVHIRLEGQSLSGNPWYAPRFKMFSFGIENQSGAADIDDVQLTTSGEGGLLANGEFTNEMQHWFFSSDRDHMPWHAKNLLVNILFDQGVVGAILFVLMTICAMWRLSFGKAKHHELAPYLISAILGFLVVGMFDSLTDVPRLAFFYYLLVFYALSLASLPRISRNERLGRPVSEHRTA